MTFARRFNRYALALAIVLAVSLAAAGAQSPAPDIARGEHLATALAGCTDCHGANLAGGRKFTGDGITVWAPNLTRGAGGIGALSDAQLARSIKAGVAPDGRALVVMPWREYAVLTDADTASLIAYLRTLAPVDATVPPPSPLPGAPAAADAAEAAAGPPAPAPGSAAYLATVAGCTHCHGANFAGGRHFGDVIAPNISHDGIGRWSFSDFQTAMRTGMVPGGRTLSPVMPWKITGHMTDAELRTLYDYLEGQSAKSE